MNKTETKHCWPTPWLEAAMRAGFAHRKGGGEWVFLNEKMRDMLAAFGAELQRDERERCAKLCEEDAFVDQWKGLAEAARRIREA